MAARCSSGKERAALLTIAKVGAMIHVLMSRADDGYASWWQVRLRKPFLRKGKKGRKDCKIGHSFLPAQV